MPSADAIAEKPVLSWYDVCALKGLLRPIIGRAKRAPHWGVQSRFRVIYVVGMSVCRNMSVVCQINCVGGITCGPRACSKSFFLRLNQ